MRRDNHKRLEVNCTPCQGSGRNGSSRCRECRGRGVVRIANPFYVPPGQMPTWFQLGGGEGWAREIHRQLQLAPGRCWGVRQTREFQAVCRMLQPWRIRSAVHCNSVALAAIAPIVEEAHRSRGTLARPGAFAALTGWSRAELGELLVEVRNRQALWALGRTAPRTKGERFEVGRIPDDRLDALIQRHPNLVLVDRLRAERARRLSAASPSPEFAR